MHFHLPKPMHGWRAFVGEVGIIVIGVLIALGAEQFVEMLTWRSNVSGAKDDLNTELERDLYFADVRVRLQGCVAKKLGLFDQIVDRAPGHRWDVPLEAPIRVWPSASWDGAIASGAVAHMSRQERSNYAQIYAEVASLRDLNLEEFKTSAELQMLGSGKPLSEASRDRFDPNTALAVTIRPLRHQHHLLAFAAEGAYVHLPKPLHGWREFIGEVGIIVVGVLIALGAESLVEDFRWHHRVNMLSAVADIDRINSLMALTAQQMIDKIRSLHLFTGAEVEKWRRQALAESRAEFGTCVEDVPLSL